MVTPLAIKRARELLGESQEEFAKRFGVDQSTLHRWETAGIPSKGPARALVERVFREIRVMAE